MRKVSAHWMLVLGALIMAVAMGRAQAATPVLYYWDFVFDKVVTGDSPSGSSPWATLRVEDTGTSGQVKFTLWANLKGSGEFISELVLNIAPFIAPTSLTGVTGGATVQSWSASLDGINFIQGERFNLSIEFPTANVPGRLTGTETVSWVLQGSGLTANHFVAKSQTEGKFYAAIHVQGITGGQEGSGKIVPSGEPQGGVIPEPATLVLFGMGLAAPLVARWRKR